MENREETPFLLTRKEGARRYGMSVRGLEEYYKRHPDFPIVRLGPKKVMIHRERADAWFDDLLEEQLG